MPVPAEKNKKGAMLLVIVAFRNMSGHFVSGVYSLFSRVTGSPELWNVLKLISVSKTNPGTYRIHLQFVM